MHRSNSPTSDRQHGLTLVELMVALAIGSFLIIGAIQIYSQSRQAFAINESIARVQETAQFALDTIEADLRMASNWGRTSRGLSIEGRSLIGDSNPKELPVPTECGDDWAINLSTPVDGFDAPSGLPCPARIAAQPDSDLLTIRKASVNDFRVDELQPGRLYIQSTRIQGEIFDGTDIPARFDPAESATHSLMVSSYYVDTDSKLVPGVPTLRRKVLGTRDGSPIIVDQEVAPGVENLQVQFGIDVNEDNTVDRYVNPGDEVYRPGTPGYAPGARVLTARIWLVVRGLSREGGIVDQRTYKPGNVNLGTFNDETRRMQVSKTILLRNTRT